MFAAITEEMVNPKKETDKAMENYIVISGMVNNFSRDMWVKACGSIEGVPAEDFAVIYLTQLGREDGRYYKDYDPEANGYRDFEHTGSVMSDLRNKACIQYCGNLLAQEWFAELSEKICGQHGFEPIPHSSIFTPKADVLTETIRLLVTRQHKTLQQSLASGCMRILENMFPDMGLVRGFTMI